MWHSIISKSEFLKFSKEYCLKLCQCINSENKDFIILDQLVSTSNIPRYIKYFDDIKVVIVDRDTRDVYLHPMEVKAHVLPKDVHQFIRVYKDNRLIIGEINHKDILKLQFEDFIFDFENTYVKLIDFIVEEKCHHVRKGEIFSVEKSKNTQLWKQYPNYNEAVAIIENELADYLYQY